MRPRNLRIEIYIVVCLKDEKKPSFEEGSYGGEIRYQMRIQRYIEWDVTLTRKLAKIRVKSGLHFKNFCYNIGIIIFYSLSLIFFFEDASSYNYVTLTRQCEMYIFSHCYS